MPETEEDWVQLAMGDACLVANLLLRLVGDRPPSSRSWLDWTVRGPRSRPLSRVPDGRTNKDPEEELKAEPAGASPSTPLSWSRATSTSGGGGPSEESHPFLLDNCLTGRSKATLGSSIPATAVSMPGKRPRQKKKSLLELKEEESMLLKERHSLKQELASLRLHVEEERALNESLKRLKTNGSQDGGFPGRGRTVGSGRTDNVANSDSDLQAWLLDNINIEQTAGQHLQDERGPNSVVPARAESPPPEQGTVAPDSQIQKLVAMGFDRTQVEVAIAAGDGDLDVAVEILMSQQG